MMKWRLLLLPVVLLATACQATGMGWIPSSIDPSEKATFGFVYDGTTQTFSGSYIDHGGAVSFKGTGVMKSGPPPAGLKIKGDACLMGEPMYESRDPNRPGFGLLTLVVCDGGDSGFDDFIMIVVNCGPFMDYQNSGTPSGNITVTQP